MTSLYWVCTLESSSLSGSFDSVKPPSSVIKLSKDQHPASSYQEPKLYPPGYYPSPEVNYGSPLGESCIAEDMTDFRCKLRELENVMLGIDSDLSETRDDDILNSIYTLPEQESCIPIMETIANRDLKQLLIACAEAVSDDDLLRAQWLMSECREMVSVSGDPIQRLGAYILEGLVARLSSSGSSIYKTLRCQERTSFDLLSYMHILHEVCPYYKFGYMSANGAIAEAMKDEKRFHVIDFGIGQGNQWVALIQAFARRPGGPPHIRITGVDDSASAYARGGGLDIVGQRLAKVARLFKVPFEFHAAAMCGSEVQLENLGIQSGEALAVNFAFILHHMPDESVTTENHRDRILRLVKSLSPNVVTLVEQESNTNTSSFYPRFLETLDYYEALFESIDVTLPREHKERINIEQQVARDVVNIIACEGTERVERNELLGKWKSRFKMAGFKPCPLSSLVNATIKSLLQNYSDRYKLEEIDGVLYLGWMNRHLIASCAWTC